MFKSQQHGHSRTARHTQPSNPRRLAVQRAALYAAEALERRVLLSATITATLTDNTSTAVTPGSTIHYTEVVSNTAAVGAGNDALAVQIANTLDPNLTFVPGSLNISPLAFDDTYSAVGNTQLFVNPAGTKPAGTVGAAIAGSIISNDVEFQNDLGATDTFTISSAFGPFATTGGGSVTLAADGSFVYTPAVGFTGADTFTYTIRDDGIDSIAGNADDLTGTGKVTINVANKVWYVNNTAAAGGDGRSNTPFDSLADVTGATGPDAAGDAIFVHTGGANYTGGITLLNNQTLWGQGDALVVGGFTLQSAATAPTIVNGAGNDVTLASGNTLRGLTLGTASGSAISGTSFGTLNVSNVTINSTGQALALDTGAFGAGAAFTSTSAGGATDVSLTSVTGSVNLGTGTLGGSFIVNGGSVSTTFAGNLSQANAAAMLDVSNGHTGTLTFNTGTLSATNGTGLQFSNADGTYNFNGIAPSKLARGGRYVTSAHS